jgi:hypothetical protein
MGPDLGRDLITVGQNVAIKFYVAQSQSVWHTAHVTFHPQPCSDASEHQPRMIVVYSKFTLNSKF